MSEFPERELIVRLEDVPEQGSARLNFPEDTHGHGICAVRQGAAVFAYLNRCPHTGAAMDWLPGQFLSRDGEHIVCSLHGAHFRVEDGYCVAGPCRGQFLQSLPVAIDGDRLRLTLEPQQTI